MITVACGGGGAVARPDHDRREDGRRARPADHPLQLPGLRRAGAPPRAGARTMRIGRSAASTARSSGSGRPRGARSRRDYQLWVFADHGQMHTEIFEEVNGRSLNDAVNAIFDGHAAYVGVHKGPARGVEGQRSALVGRRHITKAIAQAAIEDPNDEDHKLLVTALGPLGYIYPAKAHAWPQREVLAKRLGRGGDDSAGAHAGRRRPIVGIYRRRPLRHAARRGQESWATIIRFWPTPAKSWPHCATIRMRAALSSAAGRRNGISQSFVQEHGAHAGPDPEETRGFCMLPADAPVDEGDKGYSAAARLAGRGVCKPCGEARSGRRATAAEAKRARNRAAVDVQRSHLHRHGRPAFAAADRARDRTVRSGYRGLARVRRAPPPHRRPRPGPRDRRRAEDAVPFSSRRCGLPKRNTATRC